MTFGKFGTDREERINFDRMRDYRLQRAKDQMTKAGLGALITFDAWNIRYLTGAYVTIPTRWAEWQAVILPRNGDPYLFGGGSGYPDRMRREMPWLKGKVGPNRLPRMKNARTKEDIKPLVKIVGDIMYEHDVKSEPLGIDGCTSQILAQEAFKDADIKLVEGKHVMFDARRIKNRDEIECLRMACSNAEAAFSDMKEAIKPGITECEIVGVGMKRLYALGSDEAQEFVCVSGENTNPFRIDFTDRQVRPGDLIIIDVNGNSYQGYKSCYYRTFVCGKPTAEQKALFEENRAMIYAGMSAVKAGNTTLDICEKWPTDPHYWGYETWEQVMSFAVGHGVGIALHDEPYVSLSLSRANPVKLEEGMCIALETWTGKKGGRDGVRLEEQFIVTKDGYDLLTRWPINELTECPI